MPCKTKYRRVRVKAHTKRIGRKVIKVKAHYRRVLKKEVGRSGKRFENLENKIYREYLRRGFSRKRAKEIAKATAGKIFWMKFGKKKGREILRRER